MTPSRLKQTYRMNLQANSPFQGSNQVKTSQTITAFFWNAGGLNNSKYTECNEIFSTEDVDIFGISEAGAATDNTQFYAKANFSLYILPRRRQVASGLIIGVKKGLTAKFKILHEMGADKLEAAMVDVWKDKQYLRVIFLYNPPRNILDTACLECEVNNRTIIMGDFNAPSARWGYQATNSVGKSVEEFLDSSSLEAVYSSTDTPSFLSFKGETSNPDLLLSHASILPQISKFVIQSPSGYGHRAFLARYRSKEVRKNEVDNFPRWNFRKARWAEYRTLTDEEITSEIIIPGNPDRTLDKLQDKIKSCALRAMPRGRAKKYKPFWTQDLENLKISRDRAREKAEEAKSLDSMKEVRRCQARLTKEIRSAKRNSFRNFVHRLDYKSDGIKAHRFLSTLNNQAANAKTVPLRIGSKELTDDQQKALAMAKFYSQTCRLPKMKKASLDSRPPTGCLGEFDSQLFLSEITDNEMNAAMRRLKKGKSAGPDNLPAELYINLGSKAKQVLLKILNLVWNVRVPSCWKKAELIPVLKKDKDATLPGSYRPIALTNAFCKLMERIVVDRLNSFLHNKKIISDHQAGFRKNRNAAEQAIYFCEQVKSGFNRKQATAAVFVDFKSAYDKVWRKMLIHKLVNLGISGNMLHWVKSFLEHRLIRVKVGNKQSKYIQQREGLPQGSVISCTLFNIFINDLVNSLDQIPGLNCLLYADDVILYATSSSYSGLNGALNEGMNKLSEWCRTNQMTVNTDKTVCQLFTLSTVEHHTDLYYQGVKIREEDPVYLGFQLDRKMNFSKHAKMIAAKAESRLGLLKRLTGIKWGATEDVLSATYKQYVRPVLEYGQELLLTASKATTNIVDKVQNKALRIVTGAAKSTPICTMEVQTDTCPLHVRREQASLDFYERISRLNLPHWDLQIPQNRLSTQKSFIDSVRELRNRYNLEMPPAQPFLNGYGMDGLLRPAFCLEVGLKDRKNECLIPELRTMTLAWLEERYSTWVHVYTDGSANSNAQTAGAGAYCANTFEEAFPVGKGATNFDAEVCAIWRATLRLSDMESAAAVLLIDSRAAIQAVAGAEPPETSYVIKAREGIHRLLTAGWRVVMQWVPGHCGLLGNEKADTLAKQACSLRQPELPLTYKSAKSTIRGVTKDKAIREWTEKMHGKGYATLITSQVPHDLPRSVFVANFRAITGHDYLPAHLNRIGISQSATCPLCEDAVFDATHLRVCRNLGESLPKLNYEQTAQRYWSARHLIAEKQDE